MTETTEDVSRWPKVVEAGSMFAERLQSLLSDESPTLDALFEALVSFYVEALVEAFSREEQHLMFEWGDSGDMDWFALRRGFYDDGRCCDVSIDAYFTRAPSAEASDSSRRVCHELDALPTYCAEIRSLPIFQRNAHSVPVRLSLYAASAYGDSHDYPEIHLKA